MTGDEKRAALGLLHRLAGGEATGIHAPDAVLHCSHPWNEVQGAAAIGAVWAALRHAMPDMERRDLIVIGGRNLSDPRVVPDPAGRALLATMGHYQATFAADLCGIPATCGVVFLRFAEVHAMRDGRIVESWCLWDMPDLMRQAGVWPLPASLGAEGTWPGPATHDGVRIGETEDGAASFSTVMAMHAALGRFDGRSVRSMPQEVYWHPQFCWYGPAGIGTTRGMAGFRAHHQIPFLVAFPDRTGTGHYVRLADGPFVVTGGWPSVTGTHRGPWLGLPPTGRRVEMRVMDFYRLDGGLIRENWVPIDILHILAQMGVDPLARLRHLRGDPPDDLSA